MQTTVCLKEVITIKWNELTSGELARSEMIDQY